MEATVDISSPLIGRGYQTLLGRDGLKHTDCGGLEGFTRKTFNCFQAGLVWRMSTLWPQAEVWISLGGLASHSRPRTWMSVAHRRPKLVRSGLMVSRSSAGRTLAR